LTNSEVAMRQNGHEHAVAAPDLDGQLHVDLDTDGPGAVLTVPSGVGVQYRDDADEDLEDDEVAADGGMATRTTAEMRGFGLSEELAQGSILLSVVLLVAAGSQLEPNSGIALALGAAGLLTGYVGARSSWNGRTTPLGSAES